MVFAPQRLPNTASSTFSIGRERTVFWGICPCSRHGAKTQWRRRYSPRAHRLARLVVLMRSFAMAHSCPPRGIAPLLTLPRSISPGRSSLYSYFSPNACPASWRKKLAAEAFGSACALAGCSALLPILDRQLGSALSIYRANFLCSAGRCRSLRFCLRPDSARSPVVGGVPAGCPSLPPYASDLASCAVRFVLDVLARRTARDSRATGCAGDTPRSGETAPVAAPLPTRRLRLTSVRRRASKAASSRMR